MTINNGIDFGNPALIQIMSRSTQARWQPQISTETLGLHLPNQSRMTILQEAVDILSSCTPPQQHAGQTTGLVVGYVQSGKTVSFTTVAALARDNGYKLVIVIAGTSKYLLGQSRNRLIDDLRLNNNQHRVWRHIADPSIRRNSHQSILDVLDEWEDPDIPESEKRTILITVMKRHGHLQKLIDVLQLVDLDGVPTLIIDDEGDQAGLNTEVRRGRWSTTYTKLLTLKAIIPHHSYLQYTATPQAPLLINIVDVLSPEFVKVLTPGLGYVGGRELFINRQDLLRTIPQNDIPSDSNQIIAPPASLLEAMRFFFLGVAAHIVTNDNSSNRSMMVHPSQYTAPHGQYFNWVSRARQGWIDILNLEDGDPAKIELLQQFEEQYFNLQTTVTDLPPFEELVSRLRQAMLRTTVREINSSRGRSEPINWNEDAYWILVGGQAMDRGFTVEGLTVTYMPRDIGVGNADTIQQRGRFFGYKQGYLGYLRIYLEAGAIDAFCSYVEHEEDIRSQLQEYCNTGRPLSEWRRQFFLNRNLRPTRANVIDVDYQHMQFANRWMYPQGPHDVQTAVQENRELFERFIQSVDFTEHLDLRQIAHRNLVASVSLAYVYEELLIRYRVQRLEDSKLFSALLHLIQIHLSQNPDENSIVYLMSSGRPIRRDYRDDKIVELFQGVQYAQRRVVYVGDRALKDNNVLTLQLRYLNLGPSNSDLIASNIPHIAIYVPSRIARDMIQQNQGGY
jgi:hypothetical protein